MEEAVFEKLGESYFQKAKGFSSRLGLTVKEVYCPEDIADTQHTRDLGSPGEYPFTRGIYPDMYRGRLWVMRELTGFGTPKDTAERVHYLAKEGTSGINIIADVPTYLGIDADHPLAEGQIGATGVPLSSLRDMEMLLEGIPIDKVNVSIVISTCPSIIVFAQYLAAAEKRGIDVSKLRGTIQNEPILGRYRGYEPSCRYMDICLKTAGDINEYCARYVPLWNPNNINLAILQCFGIGPAMEIATGFATALAHLREVLKRDVSIDEISPKMAFFWSSDIELFEEVAKIRAARRIWARLMREDFHAQNPRSWMFRVGAFTAGYPLYPQEPLNNIIRLTLQALALTLGGVQSIFVAGYDEPVALPTEEAHRLSLRIQQIMAHETGVANTADPLGGSYYVEWLTNQIEEEAIRLLRKIEDMGGIIAAIESKWLDLEVEKASLKYRIAIDKGEITKVGVNTFAIPAERQTEIGVHRVPSHSAAEQLQALKSLKESRDKEQVKQKLAILREKAEKRQENLIPYIIEAVKAYATTGEIFGTIQQAYGYPYDSMGLSEFPFKEQRPC